MTNAFASFFNLFFLSRRPLPIMRRTNTGGRGKTFAASQKAAFVYTGLDFDDDETMSADQAIYFSPTLDQSYMAASASGPLLGSVHSSTAGSSSAPRLRTAGGITRRISRKTMPTH